MKIRHLALLGLSSVIFAACTPQSAEVTSPVPSSSPEAMIQEVDRMESPTPVMEKTITLVEQSDLGQSGEAMITPNAAGMAVVTLALTGGTFTAPQPAHIHLGSCPTPGAVKYSLTNVVDGKSVTTLDVSYDDFMKSAEKMAINVHKSEKEVKVYTACGNVN